MALPPRLRAYERGVALAAKASVTFYAISASERGSARGRRALHTATCLTPPLSLPYVSAACNLVPV